MRITFGRGTPTQLLLAPLLFCAPLPRLVATPSAAVAPLSVKSTATRAVGAATLTGAAVAGTAPPAGAAPLTGAAPPVGAGTPTAVPADVAAPTAYLLPVAGGTVTRLFRPPLTAYGPGHRGVDLAAPAAAVVRAPADGRVAYLGRIAGVLVLSLLQVDGVRTTYEPLSGLSPGVAIGAEVTRGQPMATLALGHPDCTAQAGETCLHWGALRAGHYIDPISLLAGGGIVLLPLLPP